MSDLGRLREIIATMLLMPLDHITPDTSLTSLESSLGGTRLRLALKRAGLEKLCSKGVPPTFGALEAALIGLQGANDSAAQSRAEMPTEFVELSSANLQVGIDIQQVTDLPEVVDYWTHELYQDVFARTELAYAVAKRDPRLHLAGFWCAKEALRKCDPSFLRTELALTAVAHETDGRPYLCSVTRTGSHRLPHAVSISHSGLIATAVVIGQRRGP